MISIFGALLLIFVQQFLRLRLHASGIPAIFLGSAPNLLIGFCFPFSILLRPKAFSRATYEWLFPAWCLGTLAALCGFEFFRPFRGAQTFDYHDILASFLGVALAALLYYLWLRSALTFNPNT
jgi:hypothetical protein